MPVNESTLPTTSLPPCNVNAEGMLRLPDAPKAWTAAAIAERYEGILLGDPERPASHLAAMEHAREGSVCLVANAQHRRGLSSCPGAVLLWSDTLDPPDAACLQYSTVIRLAQPQRVFAELGSHFQTRRHCRAGCSPAAWIDASAEIDPTAQVDAGVWVGAGSRIGAGVCLSTGVYIGRDVQIGAGSYLYPGCKIMDGVHLGQSVLLHPGVVIGADGFGYVAHAGSWIKQEHVGAVRIGDGVEVGANSTIDRGTLTDTVIGDGVKIDNLVHIAHNVRIGEHTAIAGCVGIAGSARIGRHCAIGGGAGILGHLEIADHVTIHAMTLVTRSIAHPGRYASGIPHQEASVWNRTLAILRRLHRHPL